jgi:peptidoglycan/LPS O-acetylase OafA/YrhL
MQIILLISLLLIIANSFLSHYFFSKPATKLLSKAYPCSFSEISFQVPSTKISAKKKKIFG